MRGISLNSKSIKQLNYATVRQNVLDDIQRPLESGVRRTDVVKPYHILCEANEYAIETVPLTKRYQIAYNKSVKKRPLS